MTLWCQAQPKQGRSSASEPGRVVGLLDLLQTVRSHERWLPGLLASQTEADIDRHALKVDSILLDLVVDAGTSLGAVCLRSRAR